MTRCLENRTFERIRNGGCYTKDIKPHLVLEIQSNPIASLALLSPSKPFALYLEPQKDAKSVFSIQTVPLSSTKNFGAILCRHKWDCHGLTGSLKSTRDFWEYFFSFTWLIRKYCELLAAHFKFIFFYEAAPKKFRRIQAQNITKHKSIRLWFFFYLNSSWRFWTQRVSLETREKNYISRFMF